MKFAYHGLVRVVSGGQTGVDQGALAAAFEMGVETGGHAPHGWRTDRGPNPLLGLLGLRQHSSSDYRPRTLANIKDSDGTLQIIFDESTPGTRLTYSGAQAANKPLFVLKLDLRDDEFLGTLLEVQTAEAVSWIVSNEIRVLNVAGHRDDRDSTAMHQLSRDIVRDVLLLLDDRNLLVRDTDI